MVGYRLWFHETMFAMISTNKIVFSKSAFSSGEGLESQMSVGRSGTLCTIHLGEPSIIATVGRLFHFKLLQLYVLSRTTNLIVRGTMYNKSHGLF